MSYLIPSHRSRPSDDPIFALSREASQRREKGESIVNATAGVLLDDDGQLSVLPTAAQAVRDVPATEWASYAPIAGPPAFLRAVIDDVLGTVPDLHKVACAAATPGGSGALRMAIDDFLEPGESLLTTDFYWSPYQTLADVSGRKVTTFSMFTSEGGFNVDALDRAIVSLIEKQGRVLLFLNDPCHNPTGYSMTEAEWKGVASVLSKHGSRAPVTLLVDMAYSAYHPSAPRAFLQSLVPLLGKVGLLFAWSASKTFTHYGLRVGALVACMGDAADRSEVESSMSYGCRGTWSNCNRGGIAAVTRLLTDESLKRACDLERDVLKLRLRSRVNAFNELARARGLSYPRYEGGFFVTVFANRSFDIAASMRESGVFVVPIAGALRVALCSVAERDVPRLVDALALGDQKLS